MVQDPRLQILQPWAGFHPELLHQSGALTDDEFAAAKSKLLGI